MSDVMSYFGKYPKPVKIVAWKCDNCGVIHETQTEAFDCCE